MRFFTLAIYAAFHSLAVAHPVVTPEELPRLPAPKPEDSRKAITVRPGFDVELAASEPNVVAPIAMAFDAHGALFVVEMRDYPLPERRDKKLGTVRKLTDRDHDGVFETSTVFLKDLPWPTGIACSEDGVYVLASPDLLFARDNNGDGIADERTVVVTGFGREHLNVQALPNSLTWNEDGTFWGATAGNGGEVQGQTLNGRDFSWNPFSNHLQAETGTAQFGLSFDESGRRFVCSNSHHLQWVPWEERHVGQLDAPHTSMLDIAADGPAATVYRTSPEEAWRVVRTRWRVTGQVPGLIEGGGRSSGYFTSACGVHIYRGDAFPAEFQGNAFTCDVGSNLVHRKVFHEMDGALSAERAADEMTSEFLASSSNWFRPVAFAIGPDGALYVADMAREIIEHPDSLPDSIKQHLDLASGENLGRIWRIVPKAWARPQRPVPADFAIAGWAQMLDHPNAWHRETAQRLLLESKDAVDLKLLQKSSSPLALAILGQRKTLSVADVRRVWATGSPQHRRRCVRWLGECFQREGGAAHELAEEMAASSDPFVLSEIPSSLTHDQPGPRLQLLVKLHRSGIPHVQRAVVLSTNTAADALEIATKVRSLELWTLIGKSGQTDALQQAQTFLEMQQPLPLEEMAALGTTPSDTAFATAREMLANGKPSDAIVTLLLRAASADLAFHLQCIGNESLPVNLRARFVPSLDQPSIDQLLRDWPTLPIGIRQVTLEWFLKLPTRASRLLELITAGTIAKTELSADQVNQARKLLPQEAPALFGVPQNRQQAINEHLNCLTLAAHAEQGEIIFKQRCLVCHQHGNEGNAIGPERKTFRNLGKPSLLVNLLDPNRDVAAAFQLITLQTKSGETQAGLLVSENAREVTIKTALGQTVTFPRETISKLEPSRLSLMPEGLEAGLTDQDLANLLEFLIQ